MEIILKKRIFTPYEIQRCEYIDTENGYKNIRYVYCEDDFTIAFLPIRTDGVLKLTDTKEIIGLIKKYI